MQIADLDKDLAAILSNKEKVLAALNQLIGQESYVRAAIAKMKADAEAAERESRKRLASALLDAEAEEAEMQAAKPENEDGSPE